jgi:hypothetical protein
MKTLKEIEEEDSRLKHINDSSSIEGGIQDEKSRSKSLNSSFPTLMSNKKRGKKKKSAINLIERLKGSSQSPGTQLFSGPSFRKMQFLGIKIEKYLQGISKSIEQLKDNSESISYSKRQSSPTIRQKYPKNRQRKPRITEFSLISPLNLQNENSFQKRLREKMNTLSNQNKYSDSKIESSGSSSASSSSSNSNNSFTTSEISSTSEKSAKSSANPKNKKTRHKKGLKGNVMKNNWSFKTKKDGLNTNQNKARNYKSAQIDMFKEEKKENVVLNLQKCEITSQQTTLPNNNHNKTKDSSHNQSPSSINQNNPFSFQNH